VLAEVGVSSRVRIWWRVSVGVRGAMVSGRMTVCGSPSPDDLKVEVISGPSSGEHGVELLA
jgi:hypothetical protein